MRDVSLGHHLRGQDAIRRGERRYESAAALETTSIQDELPIVGTAGLRVLLIYRFLRTVGFVGFWPLVVPNHGPNFVRMLDSCWISRLFEQMFVLRKSKKRAADLVFWAVGGDGFEPPTPAL